MLPKGPCTQIVYTLALKYLYRDYIKAKVYTIWVHGPLGAELLGQGMSNGVRVREVRAYNAVATSVLFPHAGAKDHDAS